jgi:hypothetical protein
MIEHIGAFGRRQRLLGESRQQIRVGMSNRRPGRL